MMDRLEYQGRENRPKSVYSSNSHTEGKDEMLKLWQIQTTNNKVRRYFLNFFISSNLLNK